jgi:membrane protease YdiL (CAAX protease family)
MFAFGVTLGPFAEEIIFRGFLLPAFATAWDWTGEKLSHHSPRPLGPNNHPRWSLAAMIFGSLLASFFFALAHASQNGWAWGPIVAVSAGSLILCAVRLVSRSLAASTFTHIAYNFTLFTVTLIRTHGLHNLHH